MDPYKKEIHAPEPRFGKRYASFPRITSQYQMAEDYFFPNWAKDYCA
jgi:hypothetical protein